MSRLEVNGEPASAENLALPAMAGYGHFTAMQVRDGRVRGLAEHLRRLKASTRLLFGHELDTDLVRGYLRQAVAGGGALSVRVKVYGRPNLEDPREPVVPDVLVSTGPPAPESPDTPLRVRSVHYERVLPEVKHLGTFGLVHHLREALLAGYDDALFVDGKGRVTEGSIWNVGFFDGDTVVWPDAPVLDGISQQLVRKGLRELGIPAETREVRPADLPGFAATFITNSETIGRPLGSLDGTDLPVDPRLTRFIQDAYNTNPWDEI
ncbi:aminotransferase class IV family protein [Amycolatopsis anabasis]|uniref:aminotransferase class IV family protein n=1 Tax=Amycolatopsis anabasis TaxID=1840409 RepID=UPI00131CCE3D|nr:aminotransferase class IV family protein [Amycolatopsis anabasis]